MPDLSQEQERAAEIAGKLTEARRRRLVKIADCPVGGNKCRAFTGHGNMACHALVEIGLAHEVGAHGLGAAYQITPLGLAVFNHIKDQSHD